MTSDFTKSTKAVAIKREWHLIDAKDKILGRLGVSVAHMLMGKSKSYFVRNLDCGDYVVVINAKNIKISGKKSAQKVYFRHSGFPGGLKAERFEELLQRKPEDIILHAVKGMLPNNTLRSSMLKRLFIFENENHPYASKI
jgi:large subunit ribosomal protein L13